MPLAPVAGVSASIAGSRIFSASRMNRIGVVLCHKCYYALIQADALHGIGFGSIATDETPPRSRACGLVSDAATVQSGCWG